MQKRLPITIYPLDLVTKCRPIGIHDECTRIDAELSSFQSRSQCHDSFTIEICRARIVDLDVPWRSEPAITINILGQCKLRSI